VNCRVFYHDKCFDGACSAAMFTRFHRECVGTADRFSYQGLVHRTGALFEETWFDTRGENAIVDFKFSASPLVTWWFDHHLSAFATVKDEETFRRGQIDGSHTMRQFFDPTYTSCTSLIAHVASTKFGMDVAPLAELIHWADIVDGAKYESGVIRFDITDQPTEGYNKFIPYYLFPNGTYNVGLSKSSFRTKVSVGTNPWTTKDAQELANISAICERYGGGGHARVGAISFPVDKEDEARAAVKEIVAELSGSL
jgi:hypothetical protein